AESAFPSVPTGFTNRDPTGKYLSVGALVSSLCWGWDRTLAAGDRLLAACIPSLWQGVFLSGWQLKPYRNSALPLLKSHPAPHGCLGPVLSPRTSPTVGGIPRVWALVGQWEGPQDWVRCPRGLTLPPVSAEVVGVGCVLDGVRYNNGQSFQPSCKYNCTCVDGAVGCTPLCLRARPPRLWCRRPRRVSVPGRCCEQWVCDDDAATRPRKTAPRHTGGFAAAAEGEPWHRNCIAFTSPWSPCSTTCGLGVSTRISNVNARCWPEQESRLCNLRPCDVHLHPLIKEGKKCLAVYQPEAPVNFTLAGCVSTRSYRPKYCGVCSDNRCCIPYKSKTIDVSFQCPDGPGFSRQVLWINACFCNLSCRNPNDIFADLESYPDFSEIAN
uniref:CCN family member 4 n=1 Tax=Equus caballus TaxID=9796 RepID=A0A9L0R0M5_HORSE